ncbi:sodium-translocating pyrophosphatase [Ruminiclostridium cellulolyticum]|uniref:K(+)-insensitive pyrophosphate-energized proton pump n=1 Tax=Ruminiclostridium cellulolyticum (strain ATCC 35319 / DSM 5812 / JCM 6584 / H10) TaxID=394503 RepID=B8I4X7_RUMCH|nr:sodium-translocating pyrophosphatase [Ruminiclostridium cellulolyticum]ACL76631.1 Inorganic H pyrophosphatase [Ruminiclostridium cellulolyticum H10]
MYLQHRQLRKNVLRVLLISLLMGFFVPLSAFAGEADLKTPPLSSTQNSILYIGMLICLLGMLFGVFQFLKIKKIAAHKSMLDVADTIYQTCRTYLVQQGKFLGLLLVFIGVCIAFYFGFLQDKGAGGVFLILFFTVMGILGSYSVAWYGIRMNTMANSRMAFSSLERKPLKLLSIPLDSGMSIGVILICVELLMMLIILRFVPHELAGAAFIGFAIGESLGASALRIAGGIFTKIADIGSDLMKIVFKIKEDDPRNPGVIADCTGDNAGDSIGPTADGFETYGVTGVALITFIVLAVTGKLQSDMIIWIFTMRILMIVTSIASFYINKLFSKIRFADSINIDFEKPLSSLIWITSFLSIIATFFASFLMIGPGTVTNESSGGLWLVLSVIISCGTLGAALIPEITKIFTSPKSVHVKETVTASREGGPSLNILSGIVAGNFSAFWKGMVFIVLMFGAYIASRMGLADIMSYPSVFAFGLVAFGFLGMGPVTIAVDSYGPVTDNAQSIYELSLIEAIPDIDSEIEKNFGFKPDFEKAKYYLEANDGAGNTFKATAKPVLIGTAVVGATTMIFSLILVIKDTLGVKPEEILNLLNPFTILGFLCGGAVIYWFTGASIQAVSTGAYRAVEYIKKNIQLDEDASSKAAVEQSKEVVKICTQYAQKGMVNIFVAVFSFSLAFAFLSAPKSGNESVALFVSYLVSIAVFGLYQAIFMANAGGCWDNAKKVVEVDLQQKGTPLHDATVVGDTVGDPFKDTSSVALNPIIKFTTLFGLLAMEIAISDTFKDIAPYAGIVLMACALYFVWRSFYKMRVNKEN